MHVVVAVSGQSSVHCACQRDSFWLPSCMCTSTAHASLLPAAERATRPTANISTPPRRSAPACKRRAQSTSMSLSDRFEIFGEQAQMYPQGTRKASKVGCKAHRAQLRTHQNHRCSNRTEEYIQGLSEDGPSPSRRSKISLIADGMMPRWGDSYAPGAAEPTLYVLPLPARP